MSWYNNLGDHITDYCDTETGFFPKKGEYMEFAPNEEKRLEYVCFVPEDGIYTVQTDIDRKIYVSVNGESVAYTGFSLKGYLPQVTRHFCKGANTLEFYFKNNRNEAVSTKFHARLIDEEGEVVPQDRMHEYIDAPKKQSLRQMPELSNWREGAGKGFKSAGRFGYTKGDGLLDYSMPSFGIIAKPHVSGSHRWTKNQLWSFSVLPDGMETSGSLYKNYVPGDNEKIDVDWSSVRWTRPDANGNPFTIDYSLIAPELLVETVADSFTLSELAGSVSCKRMLLPLRDGVLEHSDCDGVFYDEQLHGPLVENWILLYSNNAFPEIPILLIFRTPPKKILVNRNSKGAARRVDFYFGESLEWAMLGFPKGISMEDPDDVNDAYIENLISICRKRSKTSLARPVACEEYYKIEDNRVDILQQYHYKYFDDVFGTEKINMAPLPPPLMLAAEENSEIVPDTDATSFDLPTKYGPFYAVLNSKWSSYSIPIPDTRRDFVLQKAKGGVFNEDFENFLAYHDNIKEIPNPGVHQFLFSFVIPFMTFNELTEKQKEQLKERLVRNLERCCDPDSSYMARNGKRCYMWYNRTEPYSGVSYLMNYLHVIGINDLPNCEKETVSNSAYPFIEVDWGNGIGLYSIYLAALFTGRWDIIRNRWDVIRQAFDFYLVLMDWACMCTGYCENGHAWSDGTNYGGYLGFINMAEIIGDHKAYEEGIYAYAKMTAERMGLFVSGQNYFYKYYKVDKWYAEKFFCEELNYKYHHLSWPNDKMHGSFRMEGLYNLTTEGHYPEAVNMYSTYMGNALQDTLNAVEKSQPKEMSVVGPVADGKELFYHSTDAQLGEQEVYSYLLTSLYSGRYKPETIRKKIDEAVLNGRLSREFLGTSLSYRRVPNNWTEVYLRGQATCFDQVKVTLWKGIEIVKTEYPEFEIKVIDAEDAWIEFRSKKAFVLKVNGTELPCSEKRGNLYRYRIFKSGTFCIE